MSRRLFLHMSSILLTGSFRNPPEANAATLQNPSVGTVERLSDFPSKLVHARPVDVWLPPGYSPAKRYSVLYMHDGQMLFDATTTWNKKAWKVDAVASRLMAQGSVKEFIVVGPWNNGRFRHAEYFPGSSCRICPMNFGGSSFNRVCRDSRAATITYDFWWRNSSPPSTPGTRRAQSVKPRF